MPSTASSGSPGHIESLEITDFKSYKGTHYIGPFRDFTCIIGPNGSGKSNIMDSISFVLGIKTVNMRAANLKDLVYSVETGAAKKATVKLFFAVSGSKKIVFQRTVTTAGVTEYSVDAKVVSWPKYEETLREYNILAETRNCLIFQGEVESMAHKSPKEITEMIETVAGSAELKKEYEKKRKEYQDASDVLRQTSRNKHRTGIEKNTLKLHKEEAQRYHTLMKDLSLLKVEHAMLQFYNIETGIVASKKFMSVAKTGVMNSDKAFGEVESSAKEVKQRIATLHGEHLKHHKLDKDYTQQLMVKKRISAEKDAESKMMQLKVSKLQTQLKSAKEEGEKASERLKSLETDLKEQEVIMTAHEKKWKEEDKQGALSETDIAEFKKLRSIAQEETSGLTQELKQHERNLEHARHQKASYEEVKRDNEKRLHAAHEKIITFKKKEDEATGQGGAAKEQKEEWNSELMQVKGLIQRQKEELQKKEQQLKQVTDEVASIRSDRDESKSSLRMKQALEDMMELYSGVKGRLCDLITIPNKKHRVAVTVALGRHMEAIVTDNDRTAHECVQYLKDQRIGTLSFIPLPSVRGKEVTDQHRVLGGTATPVADCITCESWLDPAIKYAIGQTILVDDLKEGQQVAWEKSSRHKVVTLDGTVLQKNGVMTGGAASIENRARKFDEKLLEGKKEKRDRLAIEVRSLHTDILRADEKERDLSAQVDAQKQKEVFYKTDIQQWSSKRKELEDELKRLKAEEKDTFGPKLEALEKEIQSLEKQVDKIQGKITVEESKIFGAFGERVKIRDVRDYERRELNKEKDRAAKRAEVRSVINRLMAQSDFEKRRERPISPAELTAQLKKLEEDTKAKRKDSENRAKEEEELEKRSAKTKEKIESNGKDLRTAETELKKLKKELSMKTADREAALKKQQQLLTLQEKLRSQRNRLRSRCVAEDVDLPNVSLVDLSKRKRKREHTESDLGSNKGGSGKHVEELESTTDAEGFVTVSEVFIEGQPNDEKTTSDLGKQSAKNMTALDFTKMKESLRSAVRKGKESYLEQLTILDHAIEEKLDAIDRLIPNMKIDDKKMKGIEGEMKKTTDNWLDAQEKQKKAHLSFIKVKEKRYARFTRAFEIISNSISAVYQLLTQGTSGDAKGVAFITSDELEEPYLGGTKFSAVPPTKRYREMESLSGGEKTVAALALLFAIHKVCPSPFFVLDEVDAALDKGNVDKVINYVQKTCTNTQFLVISLKDTFYQTASSLVGVHKVRLNHSSAVKTLDLTQYE